MDMIVVLHANIGELVHANRSHQELLSNLVISYNSWYIYILALVEHPYNQVEPFPLVEFNGLSKWPLPNMFLNFYLFYSNFKTSINQASTKKTRTFNVYAYCHPHSFFSIQQTTFIGQINCLYSGMSNELPFPYWIMDAIKCPQLAMPL